MNDFRKLSGENIDFLKEDQNNTVWIGTMNRVASYNRIRGFEENSKLNDYIRMNRVQAMDIDHNQVLWVGTMDGLVAYDIESDSAWQYSQGDSLMGNDISALYVDSHNRVWVGSEGKGLTLFEAYRAECNALATEDSMFSGLEFPQLHHVFWRQSLPSELPYHRK